MDLSNKSVHGVELVMAPALAAMKAALQKDLPKVLLQTHNETAAEAYRRVRVQATASLKTAAFSEDNHPRDEKGRWTDGSGTSRANGQDKEIAHEILSAEKKFPNAGLTARKAVGLEPSPKFYKGEVDGLKVRYGVPNTDSIGATFNDESEYTELRGIREVRIKDIPQGSTIHGADDARKASYLADQIRASGEISPLIVVHDSEGTYILEGQHRFEALKQLGKKSFPAVVIVDHTLPKQRGAAAKTPPVKVDSAFDVTNPAAVAWVQAHAAELIDGISDTTKTEIRDLIESAFADQFDVYELADRISEVIGDDARAEEIARTETMTASNVGQQDAWDQAVEDGLLTGNELQEWIVTPDDRLCPICDGLDGVQAELGGMFVSDTGDQYDGAPAHPNCRCTVGLAVPS